MNITWENIIVEAKTDQKKKILKGNRGYCRAGEMLAIMGASGAGKTTLLSVLAGKKNSSLSISGTVEANGMEYSQKQFYNFGSFVFQNDILYETLTVKQTLLYSCLLKLQTRQEAIERTEQLLHQFELRKCMDTYVGGKMIKGISGGEKKRVCIAVEMVGKPSVLVLDEPTSGLDSFTANVVIKILRKLSEEGKTIIFTIHQPSYQIFHSLQRLIILNNGQSIYQGHANQIKSYIQSLGISIPSNTTLSDFFMMEISDYKRNKFNYQTPFISKQYEQKIQPQIRKQIKQIGEKNDGGYEKKSAVLPRLSQFFILLQREMRVFFRNPMKFGRALGNAFLLIFIVGIIFYDSISKHRPSSDEEYDFDTLIVYFVGAQGTAFVNVTSVIMTGIFSVSLVFPVEREVYAKQTASKTYNTLPYFLSKLILEAISICISVIVYCLGSYWLIGYQQSFQKFLIYTCILCSISLVGNSIGFLTGALFKDAARASSLAPALLLPLMMFSGLYNKLDSIPVWIRWLQYISPFRYGLHSVLLNEYGNEIYSLNRGGTFQYQDILSINLGIGQNIAITVSLALLYYFLAYLCLKSLASKLAA